MISTAHVGIFARLNAARECQQRAIDALDQAESFHVDYAYVLRQIKLAHVQLAYAAELAGLAAGNPDDTVKFPP